MRPNKNKALQCIQEICAEITGLKKLKENSEEYSLWKHKTDNVIKHIFGETSSEYSSIHNSLFPKYVVHPIGVHIDYQRAYLNRLDSLSAKLKGLESAIVLWEDDINSNDNNAISILNSILPRFHKFVRQLKNRHDKRDSINVTDEYDVQDLLHAILKLHFDDVRPEENMPSYAGSSSRVDFALKKENILIEVKKTRTNLRDKELGKQLISDIAHYSANPDYKTLVCFIYDPDELIDNPEGLERDLSRTNLEMEVVVIISPKF